jgi:hypothetical protein
MVNIRKNGNGATAASVVKGTGVGNRRGNKRQLAAMAASIAEGDVAFAPSARQLASIFGVSTAYIALAQKFSPAKRAAIIAGEDATNFSDLLSGPKAPLALPAPKVFDVDDAELEQIIRIAGIDRTLTVAAAVEARVA